MENRSRDDVTQGQQKPNSPRGLTPNNASVERSPHHTRHHHRSTGSTTPGRSRQKGGVDLVATVPKLSDLDENDPNSAEDLTGIFNKIRDEKKQGPKPPMISIDPELDFESRKKSESGSDCCCIRWCKKWW